MERVQAQFEPVLDDYNKWHKSMAEHEVDVLQLPWYKTVDRLLPDLSGKKVLEVGCGRGVFSNYLAKRFPTAEITAVDFSPSAIEIANQNFNTTTNLTFAVENAETLSFKETQFDFYISCETLEHVIRPQKMIDEISRVLKVGGQFIVTTENYLNAYILVWLKCWLTDKPFESGCGIQPHENFFLFPMIRRMVKRAKLRLQHTESNYIQWLVLPRVSPSRLCTKDLSSVVLKKMFKPFGRHFTYQGIKEK